MVGVVKGPTHHLGISHTVISVDRTKVLLLTFSRESFSVVCDYQQGFFRPTQETFKIFRHFVGLFPVLWVRGSFVVTVHRPSPSVVVTGRGKGSGASISSLVG